MDEDNFLSNLSINVAPDSGVDMGDVEEYGDHLGWREFIPDYQAWLN